MLDVAAVFWELAHTGSIRRALECCAGRKLTEVDIWRLVALAFLHDIGKANIGFQAKRWTDAAQRRRWNWPASTAGHTREALYIFEAEHLLHCLPADEMSQWGDAAGSLLRASISHHGRPVQDDPSTALTFLWAPVRANGQILYDPSATLRELGDRLHVWFPRAFDVTAEPLPDSPRFVHLFAGLVQLADWLGSDRRFFEYTRLDEDRQETVWELAARAVAGIGLNPVQWRAVLPLTVDFAQVFNVPAPRPAQATMAQDGWGHLLILESETGSGKTEAALWRFTHLFRTGLVDGLYFALPTRVAATQLYNRVREFVAHLWMGRDGQDVPVTVRALAGYESADGSDMVRLPEFQVLWADDPDDQTAHLRWAAESSKRFLAAPLAVGTIDQALLGVLQVRHAHLRQALLSRSLLVVDEVHASDAYMSVLLAQLLRAHLCAGGYALLLSATLGSVARHRYQSIAAEVVAGKPAPKPLDLADATEVPYPALSSDAHPPFDLSRLNLDDSREVSTDTGPAIRASQARPREKTVRWQLRDCIDDPAAIAAQAVEAAAQGARVLIVRNTVPAAVATLAEVEMLAREAGIENTLFRVGDIITLHHSRYSREDRPLLDAAVEQQIGKQRGPVPQGRIVIGTQTLEQSLDLDADLLITDLCPMDVLLQRLGRLHRHDRPATERPAAYRESQALVLTPSDGRLDGLLIRPRHGLGRFHGGGGIYADLRIVEATRRLIAARPACNIPRDNRMLVEHATHPEVLTAIERELGDAWAALGSAIEGETASHRIAASLQTLQFDRCFEEVTFPPDDQKITTRLGAADRLLILDPAPLGPFGIEVARLPVRHHLVSKGLPPDAEPCSLLSLPEGGFTFVWGDAHYRYSRVGLERIPADRGART